VNVLEEAELSHSRDSIASSKSGSSAIFKLKAKQKPRTAGTQAHNSTSALDTAAVRRKDFNASTSSNDVVSSNSVLAQQLSSMDSVTRKKKTSSRDGMSAEASAALMAAEAETKKGTDMYVVLDALHASGRFNHQELRRIASLLAKCDINDHAYGIDRQMRSSSGSVRSHGSTSRKSTLSSINGSTSSIPATMSSSSPNRRSRAASEDTSAVKKKRNGSDAAPAAAPNPDSLRAFAKLQSDNATSGSKAGGLNQEEAKLNGTGGGKEQLMPRCQSAAAGSSSNYEPQPPRTIRSLSLSAAVLAPSDLEPIGEQRNFVPTPGNGGSKGGLKFGRRRKSSAGDGVVGPNGEKCLVM
ncbi:hypothetical protein HDU96_008020, partial [Phlyctochytrium bullatum]